MVFNFLQIIKLARRVGKGSKKVFTLDSRKRSIDELKQDAKKNKSSPSQHSLNSKIVEKINKNIGEPDGEDSGAKLDRGSDEEASRYGVGSSDNGEGIVGTKMRMMILCPFQSVHWSLILKNIIFISMWMNLDHFAMKNSNKSRVQFFYQFKKIFS